MLDKIHYDDNMYFLTAMIRILNDAVKLSIDTEYFADKILEDTLFLDMSIQRIYVSLKDNTHLIRRNSYMHSVMKLKRNYGRLLDNLISVDSFLASFGEMMRPKLRRIVAEHMNDVKIIRENLSKSGEIKIDSDMISYDEFHFLMSPMEESSDS